MQRDHDSSQWNRVAAPRAWLGKVLTGGQTGTDRAATDVAIACGVAYGGWVPKGGWAEDHRTPPGIRAMYPAFTETLSDDPAVRSVRNVDDADGLLVLSIGEFASRGTELAFERAAQLGRPSASINVQHAAAGRLLEALVSTLVPGATLNVAGPRESEQPGVYAAVCRFLELHLPGTLS